MRIENPYHEGELQVQERVGVLREGEKNAKVISDSIVKGALRMIGQQPMAVLGSVDKEQNVWASVLVGKPAFMEAVDERTVTFDLTKIAHNPDDPFWENIQHHPEVGMLVIELSSRRRLRVNGRMTRVSDALLRLQVLESYPNCPKYIQRRHVSANLVRGDDTAPESERGNVLGPRQAAMITIADTFFVASAHPERGLDASHRGGNPGFVTVVDNRSLQIPDYPGNCMYNTLGNFVVSSRAGLIFIDFESRRTLQIIGRPEIIWKVDGSADETGGTSRFWKLHIDRWLGSDNAHQLEWSFLDYSPYNPKASDDHEK